MGLLDSIVDSAFREGPSGRVVVFGGDRRNRGYVVRSPVEELKIKSFLKMFYFAQFSILVLGAMLANACSTFLVHLEAMGRPVEHLTRNMSVAFAVYCAVVGLPYFLLWRSYKKALPSFVSAQDSVEVSGQQASLRQRKLILVIFGLALLVLAAGLLFLVRAK